MLKKVSLHRHFKVNSLIADQWLSSGILYSDRESLLADLGKTCLSHLSFWLDVFPQIVFRWRPVRKIWNVFQWSDMLVMFRSNPKEFQLEVTVFRCNKH